MLLFFVHFKNFLGLKTDLAESLAAQRAKATWMTMTCLGSEIALANLKTPTFLTFLTF